MNGCRGGRPPRRPGTGRGALSALRATSPVRWGSKGAKAYRRKASPPQRKAPTTPQWGSKVAKAQGRKASPPQWGSTREAGDRVPPLSQPTAASSPPHGGEPSAERSFASPQRKAPTTPLWGSEGPKAHGRKASPLQWGSTREAGDRVPQSPKPTTLPVRAVTRQCNRSPARKSGKNVFAIDLRQRTFFAIFVRSPGV